jgi:hypothetical protein
MGPAFVQMAGIGDITSDVGGAALRIGGVGVGALISPVLGIPSWVGGVVGYLLAAGVAKLGGET